MENIKLTRIEDAAELPVDLQEMKIKADPQLLPEEKEITVNITDGKANIFASNKTAMRYIRDRIVEDAAELNWLYYCDESIYTIDANLPYSYLTFKGKPRQSDNLSTIFN